MVQRIYVEKKAELRHEAKGMLNELRTLLGITSLTGMRIVNRYDVEGLEEVVGELTGDTYQEEDVQDLEELPEDI